VDEAAVAEEGEAEVADAKARAGVMAPVKWRLMLCNRSRQQLKMFEEVLGSQQNKFRNC